MKKDVSRQKSSNTLSPMSPDDPSPAAAASEMTAVEQSSTPDPVSTTKRRGSDEKMPFIMPSFKKKEPKGK